MYHTAFASGNRKINPPPKNKESCFFFLLFITTPRHDSHRISFIISPYFQVCHHIIRLAAWWVISIYKTLNYLFFSEGKENKSYLSAYIAPINGTQRDKMELQWLVIIEVHGKEHCQPVGSKVTVLIRVLNNTAFMGVEEL